MSAMKYVSHYFIMNRAASKLRTIAKLSFSALLSPAIADDETEGFDLIKRSVEHRETESRQEKVLADYWRNVNSKVREKHGSSEHRIRM